MELSKTGDCSSLQLALPTLGESHSRKQILNEQLFVSQLDRIIERDFFPDLAAMKKEAAFELADGQTADFDRIRELHSVRSELPNPPCDSFDTPLLDRRSAGEPGQADAQEPEHLELTLDQFLNRYTSEDNASFGELMAEAKLRHQRRHPWLYVDEQAERERVQTAAQLPSAEQQALDSVESSLGKIRPLVTWPFRNRNAVMYNPDPAPYTADELVTINAGTRQRIVFANTRFQRTPFDERHSRSLIADAAYQQSKSNVGRFDAEGRQITVGDQVRVNGYAIVPSTPQLEPGVEATPLMTWGEIEGTPLNLDHADPDPCRTPDVRLTPSTHRFKIPDISSREKLALNLTDRLARTHRDRKQAAVEQFRSQRTPVAESLFKSYTPGTPKLSEMSPAAQLLAKKALGLNRTGDLLPTNGLSPFSSYRKQAGNAGGTPATPVTPALPAKRSNGSTAAKHRSTGNELKDSQAKRNRAKDFF